MKEPVYKQMAALAEEPAAVNRSIEYMAKMLGQFLKKNERVLICVEKNEDVTCQILEQAIRGCNAIPIWLGEDRRWITMLKTAFTSKCNCIVGYPLQLLGLSKLARHMGTPLFARNVLMFGYSTSEWIVKTVEKGLDCRVWGCYDPAIGGLICGFSCGNKIGVHIRDAEYGIDIVDDEARVLPEGELGNVVIYPKLAPSLRLRTGDRGRLDTAPCVCGCKSPRLVDIDADIGQYGSLCDMGEKIHYWSSVLDCRMRRTECGLYFEAIIFQGEKLPQFPSCAQMVLRPWNPETDEPFPHHRILKKQFLMGR